METAKTYACSLKGTAMMALENWDYARSIAGEVGDGTEYGMLYTGRCQAYSCILKHITGQMNRQGWVESISAMR